MQDSMLILSTVYHKRHRPAVHAFAHQVCYLLFKMSDWHQKSKLWLFALNQKNLFSLSWKDYGVQPFVEPKAYLASLFQSFQADFNLIHDAALLTMPKVAGYVFNPVSFWLCWDQQQSLRAVVAEVNNTFGERHAYFCAKDNLEPILSSDVLKKNKLFHVSPFCTISGDYTFRFALSPENIQIDIDYEQDAQPIISTQIQGKPIAFSNWHLLQLFFKIPFLTLKVMFFIHYHALRLWLKKVPFFKKPDPSSISMS